MSSDTNKLVTESVKDVIENDPEIRDSVTKGFQTLLNNDLSHEEQKR